MRRFSSSLAAFAGFQAAFATPLATRQDNRTTFDYIVIGSGPGGSTVASRLSEDPHVTVALVEAGTWAWYGTGNQSEVPNYDYHYNSKSLNDTNPDADWGFATTPQAGIDDEIVHYARGKSLGGSSNLNYMGYIVAASGALDEWASIVEDESYAFNQSSHYYRKSMNFQSPSPLRLTNSSTMQNAAYEGEGGPLDVGYATYAQPFASWLRMGMQEAGLAPVDAFIDGQQNGSAWLTNTLNNTDGHRASAATAFLYHQSMVRPNLHIIPNTLARRILFSSHNVATGVQVEFLNTSCIYDLTATREVIVSAGTFQTPQLLQVSGIGNSALLDKFDIPVVSDLPGVGQNMTDHVFYGISYRVDVHTNSVLLYGDNMEIAVEDFNANGTGVLCSPGADYIAYEKVPRDLRTNWSQAVEDGLAAYPADWPELQLFSVPSYLGDFSSQNQDPHDGYMYTTLMATIIAPSSRGNISINSTDTNDHPLINPNWLTTERDRDIVIAGFKRVRQILTQPVLRNVTIGEEYYPGYAAVPEDDDDAIFAQIQTSFNTMYHAATSCQMGPSSNPFAVVDNRARVYGVTGLRIVDASAFPLLPPALPQAQVYWFAEKISDYIKADNANGTC